MRMDRLGHQPVLADSVLPPRVKHRSRMVWHIASQLANEDEVAILTDKPGGTMTETGSFVLPEYMASAEEAV